ncbi:MAG: hypothetical protein WAV51_00180 [Microgenomates group bacterium]
MERRITSRHDLEKTMVVIKHTRGKSQKVVLATDPYEKIPGEWYINIAPVDNPQEENIKTLSLLVYGVADVQPNTLYWLEFVGTVA